MGTAQSHFNVALAAGDIRGAVHHAIEFLLSYNPRSVYTDVADWALAANSDSTTSDTDGESGEEGS